MTYDETELALLALPASADLEAIVPQTSRIDEDAAIIAAQYRLIRFKGRLMVEMPEPYPHFVQFPKEHYYQIAYRLLAGAKRSHINEVFWHLSCMAPDLSSNDHLVLFGSLKGSRTRLTVWDMETLEVRHDISPKDCVRRSPYPMNRNGDEPVPFIMDLANYNLGLYDDIMQSLAPLVMAKKPDGVIWWLGDNANGKADLVEALHKIFPDQLAGLSLKTLIGGRYTLGLRNKLGNVAAGGIEHIEKMEVYKTIASHETLHLHQYHSQNGVEVQGNAHHIFLADTAPTFNPTRWQAISWRTHPICFNQQPVTGRARRLTNDALGQLIAEMCHYAVRVRQQGYRYEWSEATRVAKAEYYPNGGIVQKVYSHPRPTPAPFNW
jgi:hypothetical protein